MSTAAHVMRAARRRAAAVVVGGVIFAGAASDARAQLARDSAAAMMLYRETAARFAAARTMRATFEQMLLSPISKEPRTSRGELMQRLPNLFAFRFTSPAGDAIVSDGEALWVYVPSTAKGQVLKLPRELGSAFDVVVRLLANPDDRETVQVVPEFGAAPQSTVTTFALAPRAAGAPFQRARISIGRDRLVRQIEIIEPGGLKRVLTFSNMRLGATLPRGAFVFNVPPGVRVIDQAALMGPGAPRRP